MSVYLSLIFSIVFSTLSQVAQKYVAIRTSVEGHSLLKNPVFWLAMFLLSISMLFWIYVLANMDVGKAYPLLSVNYVVMLVLSRLLFKEFIPVHRVMGMLLIVGGIVMVGWS